MGAEHAARLLVVDDNADNRDLLARRLQRVGYVVETANDGLQALDLLRNRPFDLVVLDLLMPGMGGIEVLKQIRSERSKLELPVLIATAKADSDDVVRALELGANDYVTKPLDYPVVKARIESHLQVRTEMDSIMPPPAVFLQDGTAEPGTIVDGRYEVLSTIGTGGFAVVFKARQLSTGQIVALKVMRAERMIDAGVAPVELARFSREMDLIGRLDHPHVVRLIDSGNLVVHTMRRPTKARIFAQADSQVSSLLSDAPVASVPAPRAQTVPYIVMEYLDGEPFSTLITNEAPLSVERAVEIVLPVAAAVGAAHRAGVIHRDLKPANILVMHRQGRPHPVVLDFGIAKLNTEGALHLTTDSQFLGTPEYMSPEQARGATELDGRCDQYTLGVLLYEALTGRRPYRSESFIQLVHQISQGKFQRPSDFAPKLPDGLERIIMRAMDPDPTRRYSSVEAMGRALLAYVPEEHRYRYKPMFQVPSDPPVVHSLYPRVGEVDVPNTRSGRLPTRRRWGVALIGILLVATLGAGATFALRRPALPPLLTFEVEVEPASAAISLDGAPVGNGIVSLHLEASGDLHYLHASAPGYRSEVVAFRDRPPPKRIVLQRVPVPPVPTPVEVTAPDVRKGPTSESAD